MTNDELERAIDFLLKSQANLEAQSARTDGQLNQLAERLDSFAGTQANIMRVMTRTFEAQAQINSDLREGQGSLREGQASLRAALVELAGRQSKTEEALARLAEQTAGTDRRLDALIKVVGEERRDRQ